MFLAGRKYFSPMEYGLLLWTHIVVAQWRRRYKWQPCEANRVRSALREEPCPLFRQAMNKQEVPQVFTRRMSSLKNLFFLAPSLPGALPRLFHVYPLETDPRHINWMLVKSRIMLYHRRFK